MILLGKEEDLYTSTIYVSNVNWVSISPPKNPLTATVKLRSTHSGSIAHLFPTSKSKIRLKLEKPERAVTPGQSAVFYQNDILLGGGRIDYSE